VGPDIGAIVVDEDGNIAQDANAAAGAIGPEASPLFAEEVLDRLLDDELAAVAGEQGGERVVIAVRVLGGPCLLYTLTLPTKA
jgi:hypothetical protein